MEQQRDIISYSYTVDWKLRHIAHDQEYCKYNEHVIESSSGGKKTILGGLDWDQRFLRLYTVADDSSLLIQCEVKSGNSASDRCAATFHIVDRENRIFKTLNCRTTWTSRNFGCFRGSVVCGDTDVLSKHRHQLIGPDGFIRVLCRIDVTADSVDLPVTLRSIAGSTHEPVEPQQCDCGILLRSKKLHDVRLVAADGRELLAHKVILAGHSSVFYSMFDHEMREKSENVVRISDVSYEVLEALLRFVYTGRFEGLGDLASELLVAADKYDFKDLKARCERELAARITVDSAVQVYILADAHSSEYLKSAAESFIVDNAWDVGMTSDFALLHDLRIVERLHQLLMRRARDLGLYL